jgi:MoxR-like ATPase
MISEIKDLTEIKDAASKVESEISQYVVGWSGVIQSLILGIFTGGHILIEGVPGTAKTYLAKIFSDTISLSFRRIQSTPDLMPSDITGSHIFNVKTLEFDFHQGPIFSNIVLMDEINRAPPKTQSALLEVMQEGQVTIDGNTTVLEQPFMIIATKNPIEFAGTFPLPPAQLDRFMSRLIMNYPQTEAWIDILDKKNERGEIVDVNPILDGASVLSARKIIDEQVSISDDVYKFIADLCSSTRDTSNIILGASPTASVSLLNAARGYAAVINGKDSVTVDDVKAVAFDVLNHRLMVRDVVEGEDSKDYGIQKIQDILAISMENIK